MYESFLSNHHWQNTINIKGQIKSEIHIPYFKNVDSISSVKKNTKEEPPLKQIN